MFGQLNPMYWNYQSSKSSVKTFQHRSYTIRNYNEIYDHPVWMITICDLLFSGLITLMIISIKRTTHNNSQNSEKRTQKKFFHFLCGGG